MTNEPDKRNEINTTGAEGAEKPKKKKPIMIFRPQNSRTGMVKSGSRPGAAGTRKPAEAGARSAQSGTAAGRSGAAGGAAAGAAGAGAAPRKPRAARTPEAIRAAEYQAKMAAKEAEEKAARAARQAEAEKAAREAEAAEAAKRAKLEAEAAEAAAKAEAARAAAAAEEAAKAAQKAAAEAEKNAVAHSEGAGTAGVSGAAASGAATSGAASSAAVSGAATSAAASRETASGAASSAAGSGAAAKADGAAGSAAGEGNVSSTAQGTGASSAAGTGSRRPAAEGGADTGVRRPAAADGRTGVSRDGAAPRTRREGSDARPAGSTDGRFAGRTGQGTAGRTGAPGRTGTAGSSDRTGRPAGRDSREGFSARTDRGPRRDFAGEGAGSRAPRDGAGRPGAGAGRGGFSRDASRDGGARGDRQGARPFAGGSGSGRTGGFRGGAAAAGDTKPMEKEGRARNERGKNNKNVRGEKVDKFDRLEGKGAGRNTGKPKNGAKAVKPVTKPVQKEEEKIKSIVIPETLTLKELADKLKIQPTVIIKKLFMQGKMVTVNEEIDYDTAEEIAMDYDVLCEKEVKVDVIEELLKEEPDPEETLKPRPPVVCVMGHVDHGKTSLLDAIRNTHVIDREAGGITQHIGASVVECNGQMITFLDTPGHEAFTAMRMRGANSTDIAILVVAADDGVMPQTVEAINHARAAGIEIIVAINKIDKPAANIEKVKQELTEYQLIPEDWGGSTVFVPVSAKTGEGIDNLLEMVLLTSEVLELKANPDRRARGLIIEARLDKGRGPVATVLVQKGTLHMGDAICAGPCHGRIRAMLDDKGNPVTEAGPSTPVEIIGFSDVPGAGEILISPETEKEARSFAETFHSEERERMIEETKHKMSLDDLFSKIQEGNLKELNLIVKADVQGSVEAVKQSLLKLSNEEVIVKVIHSGAGAINESDVVLASASDAIIIGFNVPLAPQAKNTAEQEGVDIRLYTVIYNAIEDVERAMKGMLDPIYEEKILGHAEVRQTFRASGVGTIAGCYVLDGSFTRGCSARITREGKQIFEGAVASLKRFKDDVKEVKAGYECGLVFEKFNDLQEGDQVEAYTMVEVPR